jgi:hypothetical protein
VPQEHVASRVLGVDTHRDLLGHGAGGHEDGRRFTEQRADFGFELLDDPTGSVYVPGCTVEDLFRLVQDRLRCAPTVPTQETSACRLQLIDARCGIRRVHRLRHPISGWSQAWPIFVRSWTRLLNHTSMSSPPCRPACPSDHQ